MEKNEWGFISEDSAAYTAEKEKASSRISKMFGEAEVKEYRHLQEKIKTNSEISAFEKERFRQTLEYPRKWLIRVLESANKDNAQDFQIERGKHVINFFKICLEDSQLKEKISAASSTSEINEQMTGNMLASGAIDDALFAEMLERYIQCEQERQEEFRQYFEAYKKEFLQRVFGEIDSGYLPVDKEAVRRRVSETGFQIIDPLEAGSSVGAYANWKVKINSTIPTEDIRHAMFHELTHAISGRIIRAHSTDGAEFIETGKIGLRFEVRDTDAGFPRSEFAWLNEAVTETIALRLSGEPDKGLYLIERSILNSVTGHMAYDISKDERVLRVPLKLFFQAYFEDFDPEKDSDISPAFRKLREEVDKAMGKETMNKLQQEHG